MKIPVHSITTKLLLLFFFVGLASVALVGFYSFYSARQAIVKRTMDQLISVRAVKKQQIEYFFAEKTRNLEFLVRSNDMKLLADYYYQPDFELRGKNRLNSQPAEGPGSKEKRKSLSEARENILSYFRTYGFSNLYLLTGDSNHPDIFAMDSNPGLNDCPYQKLMVIRKEFRRADPVRIYDLFKRRDNDTLPVCLMAGAVSDGSGHMTGVAVLEISSAEINRIMLQNNSRIGLGQSGEAYLVGDDYLMRSESRFISHSVLNTKVNSLSARKAISSQTGVVETPDYRNIQVFSAFEPLNIPGLRWIVLVEIDYAESLVPVDRLRNDILIVSLVILIFILGLARLISKMISQPLISLKNAAVKTGMGDFNSRVDVKSTDEIGSLAGTFNTMIDRIREERERRLSAVYDGQELERQRVSRELHDGLGQKLIGAKLQMENCEGQDYPCLQKTFGEIKNVFGSLIEETRQISNDLMPPALNELGLDHALENLCSTASRQSNLEIAFSSHGLNEPPDNKTIVYLYRIAQEALNNAIRHSGANDISMQLIENRDNLILILEDDGIGFELEQSEPGSGNGLYNMAERARILGGTLNIETGPGKGTTIRVKIPRHK